MKTYTVLLLVLLCMACDTNQTIENNSTSHQWQNATFDELNIKQAPIDSLDLKIRTGVFGYIDHLLLIKNGKKVFDQNYGNNYYEISKGKSGDMGCGIDACKDSNQIHQFNYLYPDWHPYYQKRSIHTLQSITKSVAATAIGIAIKNKQIKSVDELVINYLQDYDLSKVDSRFKKATIKDLLTMRLGMHWKELQPTYDRNNPCTQMELSDDWGTFILQQPMDTLPNTRWNYNSGASHLLSIILKKATGQYMDAFTNQHLFQPLGIESFHWKKSKKGFTDAEGGLYLTPDDLAKIGQLHLQNGIWEDQQILPVNWVEEATFPYTDENVPGATGYGYQWWCFHNESIKAYFGLGFGGQMLLIIPEYQTVGVLNAWNVFDEEHENILREFLLAIIDMNGGE